MHSTARHQALFALALSTLFVAPSADADPPVVRGQFTDRVEHNRPVGDAASLAGARTAVYFVELDNRSGAEVHLTFVWSLDGHEVHRQSIVTRGRATWAFQPLHHAHQVSISILDEAGHQVHTDTATLGS